MVICAWTLGGFPTANGIKSSGTLATRRRARVCRYPRLSADALPGDEAVATADVTDSKPVSSGTTGAEVVAHAAAGLRAPLGLLTDSVLETKWRTQRAEAASRAAERQPPLRAPMPSAGSDWSQSDPYAAFAAFTRIAAPTAALGEGEDETTTTTTDVSIHDNRGRMNLLSPYSAGTLARRMMRYFLAKRNLDEFLTFFNGEFDNFEQVREERAKGIVPGEGGGHEHIHCSIVQPREGVLFARYYFNGDPTVVFRTRLYSVKANDKSDRGIIEMRIFRFYEETEQLLKRNKYNFDVLDDEVQEDMYNYLEGCEVFWERYEPESEEKDAASRTLDIEFGTRFVGYMKGGGCELFSNEINAKICVMDDLLLTKQQLWVADRAFDEDGNFVYGNRKGIPYKMKRVQADGSLAWTLSDAPAPEGYIP